MPPISDFSGIRALIRDANHSSWLFFEKPSLVISTDDPEQVVPCLEEIESEVKNKGLFAAGFVSYEAAPGFDKALVTRPVSGLSLLYFALFQSFVRTKDLPRSEGTWPYDLDWHSMLDKSAYTDKLERIRLYLASGDTYQVNLSYALRAAFHGDAWGLFVSLVQAQGPGYSAYIETPSHVICSASPELFFSLDGSSIRSRPMKGTAPRGLTLEEDERISSDLFLSEKNRAENVMVVDMIRSDLGKIAEHGSVGVQKLFELEKYPTLWQMTSTVAAETSASLADIFTALFPCASVTGCPKPRTMEIISELEDSPRRVYTGACGFVAPGRRAQFNVAIRTALVEKNTGRAEYRVGSGIVWDSGSESEHEECRLKSKVLAFPRPSFSLLETMLWTPEEGYFLLHYHLERLSRSARYFDFSLIPEEIHALLRKRLSEYEHCPTRVRLLLDKNGKVYLQSSMLKPPVISLPLVTLAAKAVSRNDPFLYHKTTNRRLYEQALSSRPSFDEVLLYNEDGELTEACKANVVVSCKGRLITPPVSSGLLPGTYRRRLLEKGEIEERVIPLDLLYAAEEVYLINSVTRWQRVELERPAVQSVGNLF